MAQRLLIIGAGPMGLFGALAGRQRGLDVIVLEKDQVGSALLRWGPARFFSPLGMNLPAAARDLLAERLPMDSLLTGPEFVERILRPLASSPLLRGCVRTGHCVTGIARSGLTRMELAGHPLRAERPFLVLAKTPEGERFFEADLVFDASGVTGQPCWMGPGGLPARGEREASSRIIRDLGSLASHLEKLPGKRILLVGHGHSAATAVLWLEELAERSTSTHVTWAVRSANRRPVLEIADDPLPERQRVAAGANDRAQEPASFLSVERRSIIEELVSNGDQMQVTFRGGRSQTFDEIISLTGYRPDLTFLTELALEISPASEGTARLARALAGVTDCLSIPAVDGKDLTTGEPGFFFVGSKSYGRSRTFLLRTGIAQLELILSTLPSRTQAAHDPSSERSATSA